MSEDKENFESTRQKTNELTEELWKFMHKDLAYKPHIMAGSVSQLLGILLVRSGPSYELIMENTNALCDAIKKLVEHAYKDESRQWGVEMAIKDDSNQDNNENYLNELLPWLKNIRIVPTSSLSLGIMVDDTEK